MGQHRYNVQQVNGAIATVLLTEEEAEKQGLYPENRLDIEEEPAEAKPKRGARGKAAPAPRNKARKPAVQQAPEVQLEEIPALNDTTVAAVEVTAESDQDVHDPS